MNGKSHAGSHPSSKHNRSKDKVLRLLAWEVTRSCPLRCAHCRASAQNRRYLGELTTGECVQRAKAIAEEIEADTHQVLFSLRDF